MLTRLFQYFMREFKITSTQTYGLAVEQKLKEQNKIFEMKIVKKTYS